MAAAIGSRMDRGMESPEAVAYASRAHARYIVGRRAEVASAKLPKSGGGNTRERPSWLVIDEIAVVAVGGRPAAPSDPGVETTESSARAGRRGWAVASQAQANAVMVRLATLPEGPARGAPVSPLRRSLQRRWPTRTSGPAHAPHTNDQRGVRSTLGLPRVGTTRPSG